MEEEGLVCLGEVREPDINKVWPPWRLCKKMYYDTGEGGHRVAWTSQLLSISEQITVNTGLNFSML